MAIRQKGEPVPKYEMNQDGIEYEYFEGQGWVKKKVQKEAELQMGMEAAGLAVAAAAIALGLNEAEAHKFFATAYGQTRGLDVQEKYNVLIRIAYDIKSNS